VSSSKNKKSISLSLVSCQFSKFNKLVCRFIIFTYRAGKSDIPAGSNENVKVKIVGPIIHCSPDLTRVTKRVFQVFSKQIQGYKINKYIRRGVSEYEINIYRSSS